MKIELEKSRGCWGCLSLAAGELKKYLRNLKVFWVICGFLMLVSSVWSGELENLKKDTTQISWTDEIEIGHKKGLYIKTKDGKYSLKLNFLLQSQFQYFVTERVSNIISFTLPHGQMRFFGNFFDPKLKFRVMFELPGTHGGTTANLRDMWVDWQWKKYFQIKIGQFFVFYDHENLQPTWALQFVDRSIINSNLGFERDIGMDIHGSLFSDLIEYDLFLMNGDGRNQINLNSKMMIGGRIVTNILGKHNYLISDHKKSPDPNLAIGVAAIYDMGNASIDNNRLTRVTADIVFRYLGFSVLTLVNMAYNITKKETDYGFLGQIGFFLVSNRFEVAGRWAKIFKNGALGTDSTDPQEAGVSLNYYLYGHQVKLQAEYSHLWNNVAAQGRNDNRVRFKAQLFF